MQTLQLQFESMTECPGPGPSWIPTWSQICSLFFTFPSPSLRQTDSNWVIFQLVSFFLSLSILAKLLATNSSRNFCVKVHIENVPATNLLPPLRLFFFWFFRLWSMNCPKKKPKSSDRLDIRLLHSRCAASYIKTQKKNEKKKNKTWRTSLRERRVRERWQHCGGWRCINFSNLSAMRRMNFSSFLNNFCLRVFVLLFFHFILLLCHVVISFSFGQQ